MAKKRMKRKAAVKNAKGVKKSTSTKFDFERDTVQRLGMPEAHQH
jgi:hypothetical protein